MSETILEISSISKRFGATQALSGVSLLAKRGEVLALIGENGAGKSTLMKILSGAHRPDSGTMTLEGKTFLPRGPQEARDRGVAMIYQELNLAPDLSVVDNIMLGREIHQKGWLSRRRQYQMVREALTTLGYADLDLDIPVNRLSVGLCQLVEVARALLMDAKVIVFDEPTSSLTQQDVERLFKVIEKLKNSGRAIIYISHFLEEVQEICDHYSVLRDGELQGSGSLENVTESDLVSLMVGRSVDELFPKIPHEPGENILDLQDLSGTTTPKDISLQLRRGEILGVAGLVGAGRSELLRGIFGLDAVKSGLVKVEGDPIAHSPRSRIQAGMGFVSEDRKMEGLAQSCSINDNTTLSQLGRYSTKGWLSLGKRRRAVSHWMDELQIKAQSSEQPVQALSGGNQQKVAIARVLHQDADILLLDEPTRGIDVGTKSEIYRLIGEQAAAGKAIIFVSSYLPELLAVCDRIAVMARGKLCEIRDADQWTEESAMHVAISIN